MKIIKLLPFLLLLIIFTGCSRPSVHQRLLQASAQLDQTYIPIMFYSAANRQHETELAFERFRDRWRDFYSQFHNVQLKYGVDITDQFWQEDFSICNQAVASAEAIIKQKQLTAANKALFQLQVYLPKLRRRHGLEYYPDVISRYNLIHLKIVEFIKNKARLTDRDLGELGQLQKEAQAEWNKARGQKIDAGNFKFSAKKVKAIKTLVAEEDQALGTFAAAISSKRIDLVVSATEGLEPNLNKIIRAFGDFQPIIDRLAEERRAKATTTTTLKKTKEAKKGKRR
jgi:hypothetical protein